MTPEKQKHMLRLLDRIEKHAYAAIEESVYARSYDPGSRRFDQAVKRAEEAEQVFMRALAALRAKIAEA